MDCGPWFLLCSVCDNTIHSRRPCHDREAWLGDRFHPISPTQSVDSQGAIVKQGLFFLFGFSYISEHHYFKFIAFFSIFLTSEVCCSAWAWVLFTLPQTWRVWHSSFSQHQNHCYSERYLCCAMKTCTSLALCVILHRLLRAEWCPLVLSCMHVDTNSTLHVPLMQLTEVFGQEVPSADQNIYLISNCYNITICCNCIVQAFQRQDFWRALQCFLPTEAM